MDNNSNNNNNKQIVAGGSSSSSSAMNFDHLFGPKYSSSTPSSSSSSLFGSIFPPSSSSVRITFSLTNSFVGGRDSRTQEAGGKNFGAPGTHGNKGESTSRISNKSGTNYQNEAVEPTYSYFSSSIYYGGQENYSSRSRTTEPHHIFKKDKDDYTNGKDSNSALRGNCTYAAFTAIMENCSKMRLINHSLSPRKTAQLMAA
ncbi:hypothetical protein RIF29_17470 [Crotalaria pallida]|uniref:Uncharacterized protein n=1 Tax=Crotalaria pallida TaxID=3830 RepID=A0AAN9FKM7_CROPI